MNKDPNAIDFDSAYGIDLLPSLAQCSESVTLPGLYRGSEMHSKFILRQELVMVY